MSSGAAKAYQESIDMVELHQVTLPEEEQYLFIDALIDVLKGKREALRLGIETEEEPELS